MASFLLLGSDKHCLFFFTCRFLSDKNDSSLEYKLSTENELNTAEDLEQNSVQKSDVQDSSESGNDVKSVTNSSKPMAKPTEPDFYGDRYTTDDIPSQTVSVFWA